LVEAGRSPNIEIITKAELISVEGEVGDFTAKVRRQPRYIDEELCTACGDCARYCPMVLVDTYNEGLALTKTPHRDYEQAVPASFHIDPANCLFQNHEVCRICVSACQAKAINLYEEGEELDLKVGAVIVAPGFGRISDEVLASYGYGHLPDVVTGMEFERLTSASGPTLGKVIRPSDEQHARRVAFLQCIGVRDTSCGNGYCGSVCCMYAIKEALVAKEHDPDIEISIFYMDMRTQGKEFDYARLRAKEKGIRFVRSRIAGVRENGKLLEISYVDEAGKHLKESFDMVVLPEGLESPSDARPLSKAMDIDLNHYDFCKTGAFSPLQTSRPGIFVAGAFQGPKDVPESVTDASGAAALAAAALKDVRGIGVEVKTYPAEIELEEEPRIGVFVCSCGSNIGGVVDVQELAEYADNMENVVYTDTNLYSCAQNTQEAITEKIEENRLNRVVVAACTPRTHEPLFQETLRNAGLNRCLFEMANIRDHCTWVHSSQPQEASEKSKDLIRMAVFKARGLQPLTEQKVPVTQKALVIGGGMAGMTAALSIAGQGFQCFLVEESAELGGNVRDHRFSLNGDDPRKALQDTVAEVKSNDLIEVYTNASVENVSGYVGNFTTSISTQEGSQIVEHGVVIVATGGRAYKPKQYLYGKSQQVVTQRELEERLSSTEEAKKIKDVLMIQCVGSRGEDLAYCSKVCCGQAVMNALKILEVNPDAHITILYRDMRTYGFMEDYYQLAREKGVIFVHFEKEHPPQVTQNGGGVQVEFMDKILGENVVLEPDLVVLSVGIEPNKTEALSKLLKLPLTGDGFFLEAHPKLRPVEFSVEGVYLCGLAHGPKPISESVAQARAAAGKACIHLARGYVMVEPIVSSVDQDTCIGCGLCESLCPYASIQMIKVGKKKKAETISASCKGCGICASHCPTLSISMGGFTNEQILSQITAFGGDSD
jgi:heterodisulfide reductase subunit A